MTDGEIIYGRNPVREALRAGRRRIDRIWVLPQLADADWLAGQRVIATHKAELGHMAGTSDHQGVVARAEPYPYADVRDMLEALAASIDSQTAVGVRSEMDRVEAMDEWDGIEVVIGVDEAVGAAAGVRDPQGSRRRSARRPPEPSSTCWSPGSTTSPAS